VAVAIDNAMLFRQLSEANRQLEDSYDRLKNLDSMKMEFFTLLSHELRTPLTTIKGYADLLQDGVLGTLNEEQRDKLARISAGVDRLTKIVENLSDLSSIASKKYVVDIIPVSLIDLINEVVKGMAFLAESKGIDISTDVPLNLPIVYVDRARIMQVVLNILNNAIKYTPSGGHVTIRAKDEGDHVLVSVQDTGIGIPHRDLENIFPASTIPATSCPTSTREQVLGWRFQGIVESHGGHIWAESEVGKGSTFYFTLPKNAPLK
jgi:signal transduction histidine kinase